jgi:hypothetical protein
MNKTQLQWPWWLNKSLVLKESDYWNIITITTHNVRSDWKLKEIRPISELPVELYQQILNRTNFLSRIRMRCANKLFYDKLEINDFYNIPSTYAKRLTNKILQCYPFITKLNATEKPNITDVNYLTRLEVLNASGLRCGLEPIGFLKLTGLKELNIANHRNCLWINGLTNLEVLDIRRSWGLDNNSEIRKLRKLKFLNATNNYKISNVSYLTNLEVLHARGSCGIGSVESLTNLTELNMFENTKITDLNSLTKLKVLDIGNGNDWYPGQWGCQIGDAGICKLNLVKLKAQNNPFVTNVIHMTNLKYLNASKNECGIDQNGIAGLTFNTLITKRNSKIHTKKLNK